MAGTTISGSSSSSSSSSSSETKRTGGVISIAVILVGSNAYNIKQGLDKLLTSEAKINEEISSSTKSNRFATIQFHHEKENIHWDFLVIENKGGIIDPGLLKQVRLYVPKTRLILFCPDQKESVSLKRDEDFFSDILVRSKIDLNIRAEKIVAKSLHSSSSLYANQSTMLTELVAPQLSTTDFSALNKSFLQNLAGIIRKFNLFPEFETFMMVSNPRLGADSAVYQHFLTNSMFHKPLLFLIKSFCENKNFNNREGTKEQETKSLTS